MQITFNLQIDSINVELCMESNNIIDRAFREIVKQQEILKMMGIVSGDKLTAVCNGKVLNGKHI